MKIRWADSSHDECGVSWDSTPDETMILATDDGKGDIVVAKGPHRCVKQYGHEDDPTNDDHQCCCGNTWWPTAAQT